ncbi:MAG: MmcQ/YjbR family DNA-binding protein [Bacteroidetes bacterium]|nr:MmcQ/YjbR family DNA-binding protein [Bacteroidota bacterium]
MHLDVYREYCLAKPGAWEDLPFGPDVLVFKVLNKMFSGVGLDRLSPEVSLKCDPERVPELRRLLKYVILPATAPLGRSLRCEMLAESPIRRRSRALISTEMRSSRRQST